MALYPTQVTLLLSTSSTARSVKMRRIYCEECCALQEHVGLPDLVQGHPEGKVPHLSSYAFRSSACDQVRVIRLFAELPVSRPFEEEMIV